MKKTDGETARDDAIKAMGIALVMDILAGRRGLEITPTGPVNDDGRASISGGFTIRLTPPAE